MPNNNEQPYPAAPPTDKGSLPWLTQLWQAGRWDRRRIAELEAENAVLRSELAALTNRVQTLEEV